MFFYVLNDASAYGKFYYVHRNQVQTSLSDRYPNKSLMCTDIHRYLWVDNYTPKSERRTVIYIYWFSDFHHFEELALLWPYFQIWDIDLWVTSHFSDVPFFRRPTFPKFQIQCPNLKVFFGDFFFIWNKNCNPLKEFEINAPSWAPASWCCISLRCPDPRNLRPYGLHWGLPPTLWENCRYTVPRSPLVTEEVVLAANSVDRSTKVGAPERSCSETPFRTKVVWTWTTGWGGRVEVVSCGVCPEGWRLLPCWGLPAPSTGNRLPENAAESKDLVDLLLSRRNPLPERRPRIGISLDLSGLTMKPNWVVSATISFVWIRHFWKELDRRSQSSR